jgi:Holliday junction resolvase RusA-like endonuclease
VTIVAVFRRPDERPVSVPREAWALGTRLPRAADPDADNLAKGVLDALQLGRAVAQRWLSDDNRVVGLTVHKLYGAANEAPHVEVQVVGWDLVDWCRAHQPTPQEGP